MLVTADSNVENTSSAANTTSLGLGCLGSRLAVQVEGVCSKVECLMTSGLLEATKQGK